MFKLFFTRKLENSNRGPPQKKTPEGPVPVGYFRIYCALLFRFCLKVVRVYRADYFKALNIFIFLFDNISPLL